MIGEGVGMNPAAALGRGRALGLDTDMASADMAWRRQREAVMQQQAVGNQVRTRTEAMEMVEAVATLLATAEAALNGVEHRLVGDRPQPTPDIHAMLSMPQSPAEPSLMTALVMLRDIAASLSDRAARIATIV